MPRLSFSVCRVTLTAWPLSMAWVNCAGELAGMQPPEWGCCISVTEGFRVNT